SMNPKVGRAVPSPPGRGAVRTPHPTRWRGSWSQCMWKNEKGLPKNRPLPFAIATILLSTAAVRSAEPPDYSAVDAIVTEYCLECHGSTEPEGKLIMESHELLMKGGESGAVIVPGKSAESLLVKMIEGRFEKEGKKKIMPPGSKRRKLDTNEIALIKSWIDAGALPDAAAPPKELAIPKIVPKVPPRKP